jgi:hypothetical protein
MTLARQANHDLTAYFHNRCGDILATIVQLLQVSFSLDAYNVLTRRIQIIPGNIRMRPPPTS